MKKLSLLVALMLIITVGGVYAAWNYAQGEVRAETAYLDGTVTSITEKIVSTAKGTITVDPRSSASPLKIVIDDSDNDHFGELSITGSVVGTFTPAEGSDHSVESAGIPLEFVLSYTGLEYKNTSIFTIDTTPQPINNGAPVKGSYTISAATLSSLITLNSLELPTAEEYDLFRQALHSGSISITVREAVTPTP